MLLGILVLHQKFMSSNRQFFKNFGVNGVNFLTKLILGLVLPPFIISKLGISAFGIVQVAISTAAYAALLSTSLNQANNRFVSISFINKDYTDLNKVLTTIFILYGVSFLVVLPLLVFVSFNVDSFFDIGNLTAKSGHYMFFLITVSQLFVMFNTALSGPLYANNRLDIIQGINISRNLLKVILVFVLLMYVQLSLMSVGIAFFVAAVVSTIIAAISFIKYTPQYRFKFYDFDKQKLGQISSLSAWTGISVIGSMIFSQTDIIIVNIFLGAEKSGEYALLVQWNILLISISTILSGVIAPNIMIEYAKRKFEEVNELFLSSIKYQGFFIALPATIVFVYADVILKVWVGDAHISLAPYLQVMILHLGLSQAFRQVYTVNTAFNKMKFQGLITLAVGGLHVIVSITLILFFESGILGVIVSSTIFYFILHVLVLPLYVIRYLNLSLVQLYSYMLPVLKSIIIVLLFGYLFKYIVFPSSFISLLHAIFFTILFVLPTIFFTLLKKEEQSYLRSLFFKVLKR